MHLGAQAEGHNPVIPLHRVYTVALSPVMKMDTKIYKLLYNFLIGSHLPPHGMLAEQTW